MNLRSLNLSLQISNLVLDLLSQTLGFSNKFLSLLVGGIEGTLARFVLLAVLLANGIALIGALDTADPVVLLGAITAQVVVADTVVDKRERDVGTLVALVLAPETGQGVGRIGRATQRALERLRGRKTVELRAGGGSGLVAAIRAVARVVVDL